MIKDNYIFIDFKLPSKTVLQKNLVKIKSYGFTHVVIGMNHDGETLLKPIDKKESYETFITMCRNEGLVPVLMPWIHRQKKYIESVTSYLDPIMMSHKPDIMFDAEYYWIKGAGLSPQDASDLIQKQTDGWDGLLSVTSYAVCPSNVAILSQFISTGVAQAYSVFMSNKKYTHGNLYRPGNLQNRAATSWETFDYKIMALPLYAQEHPNPHPKGVAALEVALNTTKEISVKDPAWKGVAWWSYKSLNYNEALFMKKNFKP